MNNTNKIKGTASGFNSDNNLSDRPEVPTMGDAANIISQPDVAPSTASQQVTGFIDDATTMDVSLPQLTEPTLNVIRDSMESRLHTIVDVLSRPVTVSRGLWQAGDIQETQILELDFPQAIFDNSPNVVDKLNYFAFLRADVCIRVMVNANTFQQGKLIGYFTPFTQYVGERRAVSDYLTANTCFPYVINDASVGNTTNLVIPYVAPYSSYRLFDKTGNIGSFFLKILNPLRGGDAYFTVQAWFTNISVDLPSGLLNDLTADTTLINDVKRMIDQEPDAHRRVRRVVNRYKAQVATEGEQKSRGFISSTFHQIHEVGRMASKYPMIADVAIPLSWIAKAIAHVAEYFGYAKPQDVGSSCKFAQIPAYGFTNAGGIDQATVLGSSIENSLEPRGDMFGSQMDDMDINYVCAHRCFVRSFNMTTAQLAGTELVSFPVTPGWCVLDTTERCYRPTALAFVASMFNLWRGGIRYKIQAAKTAYHSGRIRIVYIPGSFNSTVDSADQAYNWVFDMRNQSEIEFTIPYNNILEWQQCNLTDDIESLTSIGTVRIEVFNQLRAPDSVAADIDFNIWTAGESDMQFSIPTFQRYVPSLPTQPVFGEPSKGRYIAHVLGTAQDHGFNDMADKPKLFETSHSSKVDPCKYSIGEMVTNLRYLTRRFASTQSLSIGDSNIVRWQFPNYYFGSAFDPETDDITTFKVTPIDYISFLYRFFRGGMRWKAMYQGPVISGGYQEFILAHGVPSSRQPTSIEDSVYNRFFTMASTFWHRTFNNINPVCEVMAPFYSQVPIRAITGVDVAQPTFLEDSSVLYRGQIYASSPNDSVEILRAGADDFTFGWMVGPPRLRPRDGSFLQLDLSGVSLFYESPTYQINAVGGSVALPAGNYQILGANVDFIPAIFDTTAGQVTEQYPPGAYTLISSGDINSYSLLQNAAPAPTGGTFNATATKASIITLGPAGDGKIIVDVIIE